MKINGLIFGVSSLILIWLSSVFQFSILDLIVFVAYIALLVFFPGYMLLSLFSFSGIPRPAVFVLANAIGLASLCYFSWLLNAKLGLPYYSYVYALALLYIVHFAKSWRSRKEKMFALEKMIPTLGSAECGIALVLGIFALLLSSGMMKNGAVTNGNYDFYSTVGIEGLWQLGNIAYLKKSFDFADIHQNAHKFPYHIFIYIFIALGSKLAHLEIATIFFKFLPLYQFFALLGSAYVLGCIFFKNRLVGIMSAVFIVLLDDAVFAVKLAPLLNAEWLKYLYFGPKITSALFSSPTHVAALMIFIPAVLLLKNPAADPANERLKKMALAGFLLGTIVGFKVNSFAVIALSLVILAALEVVVHRRANFLLAGCIAFIVSFPLLLDIQQAAPRSFIANIGYFPLSSSLGQFLLDLSGSRGILLILIPIYLVLELGPKLLSFRFIFYDWKSSEDGVKFLWVCSVTGITVALLVTPSYNPYDAMYFHRFACMCLVLFMGRTFVHWIASKSKKSAAIFAMICLFYLSGGLYTFFRLRAESTLKVPVDKIAALKTLRTPNDHEFKTIMSNRFAWDGDMPNVNRFYLYSAFAENIILSEGEAYSPIHHADSLAFKAMRRDIQTFYATPDARVAKNIIEKWNIDFVIIDLEFGQRLNFETGFLEKIHESKNMLIYAYRKTESGLLRS